MAPPPLHTPLTFTYSPPTLGMISGWLHFPILVSFGCVLKEKNLWKFWNFLSIKNSLEEKKRPVLAFHSWPLIFRENCRRDLFILNEWNSIGTLFASWECVCFKKTNWIFFTIATGMEVIFCLLSINAIPHPSRKSLVSSKPCCIFPPLLLLTWIKRTRKKVFFFFVFAGRSSSPVELQLVGPNYPKARLSLSIVLYFSPFVFWTKSNYKINFQIVFLFIFFFYKY